MTDIYNVGAIFQFLCAFGLLILALTVEVRLKNGPSENQGRVEVKLEGEDQWGTVCDENFGEREAVVVCRQLGYKYSRNEKKVYIPRLPDYQLENVACAGHETDIGSCINGDWKTGDGRCDTKSNSYAGVCCSNSPTFGDFSGDFFRSHCAENWVTSEETCERNKASLLSFEDYQTLTGSSDKTSDKQADGFWTKGFFTPWIWSNGCFQFKDSAFTQEQFEIEGNSVQACLQLCSLDSKPASFLLSENFCRCLTGDLSLVSEAVPGRCNTKCSGDATFFCGSGSGLFWNLYTVASPEIFYRISDPGAKDRKQCAVMEDNRKLSTVGCYSRNGYICGQILKGENYTMPRLLFFKNSPVYEITMQEARIKCTKDDNTLRLVGETVLQQEVKFSKYGNLWVDIARTLANTFPVHAEPGSIDAHRWHHLEPSWCLAWVKRGEGYTDEILPCQSRFKYICLLNNGGHTSAKEDSSAKTTTTSGQTVTIAVAVVCGTVLVAVAIIVVYCIRRKSKRSNRPAIFHVDTVHQEQPSINVYNATYDTSEATAEHIYSEIKNMDGNVYSEVDELLQKPEDITEERDQKATDHCFKDTLKEPVTIKRSYSSPKDVTELAGLNSEDTQGFKGPDYIYPYDNAIRSENDNGDEAEIDGKVSDDEGEKPTDEKLSCDETQMTCNSKNTEV